MIQVVYTLITVLFSGDKSLFSNEMLLKIGKIAIIAVVILVVSIPEGLPLAVSIAMALSINSLKKDKILIKNLESIQTCATLHEVCVGKTGTLTDGKMSVRKFHVIDHENTNNNDSINNPDFFSSEFEIN